MKKLYKAAIIAAGVIAQAEFTSRIYVIRPRELKMKKIYKAGIIAAAVVGLAAAYLAPSFIRGHNSSLNQICGYSENQRDGNLEVLIGDECEKEDPNRIYGLTLPWINATKVAQTEKTETWDYNGFAVTFEETNEYRPRVDSIEGVKNVRK